MTAQQLELGQALRDQGIACVEGAAQQWERDAIDQAITDAASRGQAFSANDIRPHLPAGIRPALIGARFRTAASRKLIRRIGYVPSTEPGTHAHPIALWEGTH